MRALAAVTIALLVVSSIAAPAVAQPFEPINGTGNGTNGTSSVDPAANASNGTNATNLTGPGNATANGTGGSGFGVGGFGIPSTDELASSMVNATIGAVTDTFENATATAFLLPWDLITIRFAPFEAAGSFGSNAWSRPPGVWGEIYDLAVGSIFRLAVLLFVLMFVLDWFGNLSPHAAMSALDRMLLRAADTLHLLFSWPIAWAHFLIASAIAAAFLPSRDAVASTVNEGLGGVVGLLGAGGAVIVLPFLLLIVAWLLLKHGGAFVYVFVGLAAYPALVAASIPDHWILGKLGAYAENARATYPKAAWYPVPTAVVLGIGYSVDQAVLELLTAGEYLNDAAGGGIFYPILWLVALYAPEKVLNDASITDKAKQAAPGAIAGGAAGAATGTAAGASSGAAAGSAAGSASGAASGAGGALAGAGGSAAGSLPEGRAGGSGSAGSMTLAGDGGTRAVGATDSGTSFGGSGGADVGTDAAGSTVAADAGAGGSASIDAAPDREAVDMDQRYEPVIEQDKGGFSRVERPRDAEWLVDQGGVSRLDQATDEPLRFRGERDGAIYDLRGASTDAGTFGDPNAGDKESVRNTEQ